MKLDNLRFLGSATILALLGGGILSTTPEAKAQQVLIESDRLLEYPYRWQGHKPRNESECLQGAGEALRSEINQMSNISQFDSFANSNASSSLSNKYEGIGKYIKNTTTFTDSRSSSGSFSAAQRGLVVSVAPQDFKPNTFGNSYKRDQLTGKRESACWGTLRYKFVVYGPNSVTALNSGNQSTANNTSSPSIDIVARKGNEKSQQWKLEKLSNGRYVIWSSNGTHVMDVPRGNVVSFVSRQTGERSQQWRLEKLSNGNYVIWTHDRSQVIDVPRGNTATLASRQSREKSQQWRLEKLSNDNYVIWSSNGSQVMDVP